MHKINKSSKLTIFGKKPIVEVIHSQPSMVNHIFISDSAQQDSNLQEIRELAHKHKIPMSNFSEKKVTDLVGKDAHHQGVVAELKYFPYTEFPDWLSSLDLEKNPAVMILDEVQDPHNVGAIIRTAAAAGMAAVLLPEHRQAPVTGTVFKTSAGAIMHIPVIRVGNVNQAIELLKKSKFWIYGITGEGTTSLFDYVHDSPAAFVVGSEGTGIRHLTLEKCDHTISIPMNHQVESLNASVSAALVAYEWKRKSDI